MTNDRSEYWAAKPTDEVGQEILKRVSNYYDYIHKNGRLSLWRRSYQAYYQSVRNGGSVYHSGDQDQYTNLDINDYRNLLLHLKSMIMEQRIAYDPQAINTDHESMSQVILAKSILEAEIREGELEDVSDKAVENALVFGEGYIELKWDASAGEEYVVDDEQNVVREGELKKFVYTPTDLAFDYTRNNTNHDWYVTRHFKNRYDLMAKFPELEEEIKNASFLDNQKDTIFGLSLTEESDLIPVYTLHHRPSDALPDGRYVELVSSDAILIEGPYQYKKLQIYPIQPSNQTGTPFGYTVGFDLLAPQEASNNLHATISTNQEIFGVQNIIVPKGAGFNVSQFADGLNFIECDYEMGEPKALNLTATPVEIFNYLQTLGQKMETLSGISQVSRNSADVTNLSGAAMALLQATSIQFNSDLQRSYTKLMERLGTGIIQIYQTYADTKRVAAVVGKSNRPLMKSWTKDDIAGIQRVTVDIGNPLTRSTAGKMAIADQLLQAGMLENNDQYLQLLDTGKLDPLIQGKRDELLNIKSENERLSEGIPVQAVDTDNHAMHIIEHKTVIASPEGRENPKILKSTLAHIQEHINALRTVDPLLLQITGQQPAPPANPQLGQQMPQPQGQANGQLPEPAEEAGVRMPNMPKNPLTGNQFNMGDGGM